MRRQGGLPVDRQYRGLGMFGLRCPERRGIDLQDLGRPGDAGAQPCRVGPALIAMSTTSCAQGPQPPSSVEDSKAPAQTCGAGPRYWLNIENPARRTLDPVEASMTSCI